ncbi:hypothetical protein V2A60_005022 [Cordyceps javanica]
MRPTAALTLAAVYAALTAAAPSGSRIECRPKANLSSLNGGYTSAPGSVSPKTGQGMPSPGDEVTASPKDKEHMPYGGDNKTPSLMNNEHAPGSEAKTVSSLEAVMYAPISGEKGTPPPDMATIPQIKKHCDATSNSKTCMEGANKCARYFLASESERHIPILKIQICADKQNPTTATAPTEKYVPLPADKNTPPPDMATISPVKKQCDATSDSKTCMECANKCVRGLVSHFESSIPIPVIQDCAEKTQTSTYTMEIYIKVLISMKITKYDRVIPSGALPPVSAGPTQYNQTSVTEAKTTATPTGGRHAYGPPPSASQGRICYRSKDDYSSAYRRETYLWSPAFCVADYAYGRGKADLDHD